MQIFLVIAAALLLSAYSAPTSELPINSTEEEVTTETQDYIADILNLDSLQNVTKIELPDGDKKILCDFLATFEIIKMQQFGAIFAINMEFMKNIENKFEKDFKEYQDKHPNKDNKTQLEEFIGVGVNPLKVYAKNRVYKKKFYQDIGKLYQMVNEHFIKESQIIKSNLTQETVENEVGFFEKFKIFEVPSNKYYNDKIDLINDIEEEYKNRYFRNPNVEQWHTTGHKSLSYISPAAAASSFCISSSISTIFIIIIIIIISSS
ncbi:uncharacterized protein [Drosophila kikkawai]|uniref:Uncharacterized protein n=1 Tax=Drosophila kikkawai TaxID=30033 RepID=A0ABM4GAB5_DROKI